MNLKEDDKEYVNHPDHYNRFSQEVIDTIQEWIMGYDDAVIGYLLGTVLKYIPRAPYKHETPYEDLEKAYFYFTELMSYLKEQGFIE